MGKKSNIKSATSTSLKTSQPKPKIENNRPARPWGWLLALVVITIACYYPTLDNGFVNWDDDRNVYENNTILGKLDGKMLKEIFTTDVIGNYNPLPILTFAVEKHFFGLDPKVMHKTNLVLHLLCCLLVFFILLRLGLKHWIAFFGAVLFAIHPMHVESVAWITERKDVLFGLFFLWALYLYIKHYDNLSTFKYIQIFILFVIGLFAKVQMVSLPLTFLAYDWYKQGHFNIKQVIRLAPFFLGSLAMGLTNMYFLRSQGSLETVHGGLLRLFIGSYSYLHYLYKLIVPYPTVPLYPYPAILKIWHYISLPIALATVYPLWILYKKGHRAFIFGFAFFFLNIVFVLQILGAGQAFLADRFSYIPYVGLFFIICYYMQDYISKYQSREKLFMSIAGIVSIIYFVMSFRQNDIWQNSGVLWTHVIKYYDNTQMPFGNRANYYRGEKQYEKAIADYNNAIRLSPQHGTYNSRARLYFILNQDDKALADYNEAIRLKSDKAEYYVNRGAVLARSGRTKEALDDFNKGLQIDPKWDVGYLNRSITLNQIGDFEGAFKDVESYLKLKPANADLWYEGARSLRILKRDPEALQYFTKAIEYSPKMALFYVERAKCNYSLGNFPAAKTDLNTAKQLGERIDPELERTIMSK